MKKMIVTLFVLSLVVLPGLSVWAGACDPEREAGITRRIDGPANIRQEPNGKVIASLPNKSEVVMVKSQEVTGKKGLEYWYQIEWQQGNQKFRGWTHEQNIICD